MTVATLGLRLLAVSLAVPRCSHALLGSAGAWSVFSGPTAAGLSAGRILVVGDGDLSFSAALAAHLPDSVSLLPTTLESEATITERYSTAQRSIDALVARGAAPQHGVDATRLDGDTAAWDRIIFMFPHAPGKANVRRGRELLSRFFASAAGVLAPGGEVLVSLRAPQAGLAEPTDSDASATKSDNAAVLAWRLSWQPQLAAADAGLVLAQDHPFDPYLLEGYAPRGHRGHGVDRKFDASRACLLSFAQEGSAVPVARPLRFCFELQLVDSDNGSRAPPAAAVLVEAARAAAGNDGDDVCAAQLKEMYCPENGAFAGCRCHIFAVTLASRRRALTAARADGLARRIEAGLMSGLPGAPWALRRAGRPVSKALPGAVAASA